MFRHLYRYPSVETHFSKMTYNLIDAVERGDSSSGTKMSMLSEQLKGIISQDSASKILVLGREEHHSNSLMVASSATKKVLSDLGLDSESSMVALFGGSSNKVTKEEMGKRASEFQRRDDVRVCLLAMRSCYGLNLTAASHVICISPHLSPAIEEQAIARVIRIGSKMETVPVIRLAISESFEYELAKKRAAPEVQVDAKLLWEQGKNDQLVKKLRTDGEREAFMLPAHVPESADDAVIDEDEI